MFIRPQLPHNATQYYIVLWPKDLVWLQNARPTWVLTTFLLVKPRKPSGDTDGGEKVKGRPLKGLPTSCFRSPPLLPGLCDVNSLPHTLMPSSESPRPLLWHVGLKLPENMDSNKNPSPKFSMSGHRNVKVNSTFSSPTVFPKYCARKTNKQTKTSWNSISKLELFRLSSWRRSGSTGTSSKTVASTAL